MKKLYNSTKWLVLISGVLIAILGISMLFTPLENLVTLALFIAICTVGIILVGYLFNAIQGFIL